MDTKTITKRTKQAVAIGLCASLVGGVAAPVLSTTHDAYAAVAGKPDVNTAHSSIIQFNNENLKNEILRQMKNEGIVNSSVTEITEADALKVKKLDLHETIYSFDWLEKFKNLTKLGLFQKCMSDLKPLAGLTNLTKLDLDSCNISDLTPLAGLTNLTSLNLGGNYISDLKPLAGLTNLTKLDLLFNHISDLTPLAGMTKLTWLALDHNSISNLKPLAGLTNLTSLNLGGNHISDLKLLKGLIKLETLYATDQTINLQPTTTKVNLTKEIKGFGNIKFKADENVENGVLTHKEGMKNPYTVQASDESGNKKYSATINVDFSNANKGTEIQTEDISEELKTLLDGDNAVKATDNYKNADDNLKQAYDKAITDGKAIYDKLSSTSEQVQQACAQIKAAFGKLNGDAKASATASQLQNRIQQLEQELEKAKRQGTADKSKIEELNGQISTLNGQLEKLKSDKTLSEQEKQAEIDKLNGQITELGKQISQLTSEKQSLQQLLDTATGKISTLTSELEQLKVAKKQADEKNQQIIASLNSQITQLGKDKQGLQEQINGKQTEISKLQEQIQTLKDDHSKSDTEKQKEIDRLSGQVASLTQEKQGLQGQLDAANEKARTLTQQLQQAQSRADADTKQIRELTDAVRQTKQQLEQLRQDKTKSDTDKQKEIERLNAKIAELEKKVQTCSAQVVGGSIVAPLVNEKPTFDIEKYKREHPDEFTNDQHIDTPSSSFHHTDQIKPDIFTQQVHDALQQLAPMAASTTTSAQATAQRTDESERAQAEQKADTSSKQEAEQVKLDQSKFPQTGDNSLLTLLSTFAGALVLVLGCFARKKQSHNINKK